MKNLIVSLVLSIVVSLIFVAGLLTASTTLTMSAFCSWTPVMIYLGFSLGRSGLRINFDSQPVQTRQRVLN